MGRKNQRARRSQQRRETPEAPRPEARQPERAGLSRGIAAAAFLVVLALVVALQLSQRRPQLPTGLTPGPGTPLAVTGASIDGIRCDTMEQVEYHVHAHLTILDGSRQIIVPANTGINDACLYWLHTHDESGIIHIEAPKPFTPTLGDFFDIWGQPLSSNRVADAAVQPGQRMRVFVNLRAYTGDPRRIALRAHTTVTIEIGPPFPAPQKFDFGDL